MLTKEELLRYVTAGLSIRQIAAQEGKGYSTIRWYLKRFAIPVERQKFKVKWSKEVLEDLVKESITLSDVLRKLDLKPLAGNYGTLKKYLQMYSISIEHFRGRASGKYGVKRRTLEEILVLGSTYPRGHLKIRLLEEKILVNRCYCCGMEPLWQGKSLVLVLDHINGINNDNRRENLQLLCPNCNSQTTTFCTRRAEIT